jgi:hypothetical protein
MANLLEQHTALYTDLDIEYAQEMSGPYRSICDSSDGSSSTTAAYRFLPAAGHAGVSIAAVKDHRITGFWRPAVCFGSAEFQKVQLSQWIQTTNDITYLDYLEDGELSPISRFLLANGYKEFSPDHCSLLKRCYVATPVYTQVLDVTLAESVLRRGLRKSYHSLVNKQADVWDCTVADMRAIHLKYRGVTRSDASWKIQERMQTVCFADGERAAVMFYYGPRWAYYAAAAGENGHACLWAALMKLKSLGVWNVEMGEQVYAGPDAKKINIAAYKRGFGGVTKTRLLLTKGPD